MIFSIIDEKTADFGGIFDLIENVAMPGEKWQKSALFARYRRSFAVNVWVRDGFGRCR